MRAAILADAAHPVRASRVRDSPRRSLVTDDGPGLVSDVMAMPCAPGAAIMGPTPPDPLGEQMARQGRRSRNQADSVTRRAARALLLPGLLGLVLTAQAASFEDGFDAYKAGDHALARSTWEQAANNGDSRSMFSLGSLYMRGTGVPQDNTQAYAWFRRAAEAGLPQAQYNVAFMLEQGSGVDSDPAAALEWYAKSARNGLPQAQAAYASRLWDGRGTEANPELAARFFESAARQGHPEAQNSLGTMLENGIGIAADPGQAALWYERAALKGVRDAQASLSRLYREGRGVTANGERADYWAARARGEREGEPPPGTLTPLPSTAIAASGRDVPAPTGQVAATPKPPAEKPATATEPAPRPAAERVARVEPKPESKPVPKSEPKPEPKPEPVARVQASALPKPPTTTGPAKSRPEPRVAKATSPKPTVKPGPASTPGQPAAPVGWFDAAPAKHFTAQLIGSSNPDALERFVSKNKLGDAAALIETQRNGKAWFLVVYGDFASRSAANKAFSDLPLGVRKHGGWVRTIGEVRKLRDGG
jgi:TPR repeat protein